MDNSSRKLILITNDDSVDAPGIHHLAECVRSMGDVYVVAPAHPHSGQSAAMSIFEPLRIRELTPKTEGVRLFTVNGTPVDCVKLALGEILPRRPDVIFAGINHGSNSGVNVTYSGTMGAVLEGCLEGIPSVGFSLLHHSLKADFTLSTAFVAAIASAVIEKVCRKVFASTSISLLKYFPKESKCAVPHEVAGPTAISAISTLPACRSICLRGASSIRNRMPKTQTNTGCRGGMSPLSPYLPTKRHLPP